MSSRSVFHLLSVAMLLCASAASYGQAGIPNRVTATSGSGLGGAVNTVLAGQWFQQRGDGSANVAVNYDFVNNAYQDSPNLRVNGKPFSVAFWYRSTQLSQTQYSIIWDNADSQGSYGYVVGMNIGFISVSEQNGGAGCTFAWRNASTPTNDGQWHHAAVVADRTAGHTYIYRDGTLDSTLPYCDPADNTFDSSTDWYGIGRNCGAGCGPYDFAGEIDHFTTWVGAALTPAEVNAHMDGGIPQVASVGVWYEFENANGQRVPDLGPNHYDGHVSPDTTPLLGPNPALQALVTDAYANPVPDVAVTFTTPTRGASGTFTSGLSTVTVTTDATGTATAPIFTTNSIPGYYTLQANIIGVNTPAKFHLANGPTFTTVGALPDPSYLGQPVTFTATVTSPGATPAGGTVTFRQGSAVLGTVSLDGAGTASFGTSALALGNNNVFAIYSGSSNFAPSTSTSVTEVVQPKPTTTVVTSPGSPFPSGQPITFTVSVSSPLGGNPTGKAIVFYDGKKFGQAYLDATGHALITGTLPSGSHSITGQYNGSPNYAPSSSPVLLQQVQ